MKEKVRPIYSELQGYLAQAPSEMVGKSAYSFDIELIKVLSEAISSLQEITEKDYSKFSVKIMGSRDRSTFQKNEYRGKLAGLIARLHGEYFSDEPAPFAGMPSTIITQTQGQNQSVDFQLTLLLNVQSKIDEQLPKFPEGSKEKTFLQKLKGSLRGIKDATQLISQLVILANNAGLTVDDLSKIFT